MDLYLIRHADALPLGEGGAKDDGERPLSDTGHAECQKLAAALQHVGVRLDRVVTSPLLRARQTAEGLLKHWTAEPPVPTPSLDVCGALAPDGKPRKLARYLLKLTDTSVALVGHMPDLAGHAAWLIGSKKAQLELAKAGVAFVECDKLPSKGTGVLRWLVTPAWYC